MKVLVVGSGGREHALAWKLAQSPRVSAVLVAPGNAGTAHEPRCRNVDVALDDLPGLRDLVRRERVGFTVVGPEAPAAARDMLGGGALGAAGSRVVVEEFLAGEEASFIIVAAGGEFVELATSQDHKRVGDGDSGPNTGGMGAYSPAPVVTGAVRERVLREIIQPTLDGLKQDGIDFTGFLYAGLMIDRSGAPRTLEFNCRLGDP